MFFFLLGNFVSAKYNLSSAYMPSFQKKEVGSVGQRIQLAPLVGQHTSRFFCLSSLRLIFIAVFSRNNSSNNHTSLIFSF